MNENKVASVSHHHWDNRDNKCKSIGSNDNKSLSVARRVNGEQWREKSKKSTKLDYNKISSVARRVNGGKCRKKSTKLDYN